MNIEFGKLKATYSEASKKNNESLKAELVSKMRDNLRKRNNGKDYVRSDIEDKSFCLDTAELKDLYAADGALDRLAATQKSQKVAKNKRQEYGLEK